MAVLMERSLSPGTPCAGGCHHISNNGMLLAVCPDAAILMAVVALRKLLLRWLEKLLGFHRSEQSDEKQG
jgi:hypothetical protein